MKHRSISGYVKKLAADPQGRILVFTGARQTGKTTLVRRIFPGYKYLSIEDPIMRVEYEKLSATQWKELYPLAALDEVQKAPALIEAIKSVYDQWMEPRYILLGSSQLLLLEKVRESLAGRCVVIEFFPLTVPELETNDWNDKTADSLFISFVLHPDSPPSFLPSFLLDAKMSVKQAAWDFYRAFGGYPALTAPQMDEDERYLWLGEYVRTYLERDIRDLASFRDLEPFIKLQQYLALQTGQTINTTSIATQLGVSAKTVQRYIRYFELSYQALVLPAWSNNRNKRLVKAPKIHYLDNGVLQAVLRKRGGVTGAEFESLVIAEIYKQMRTVRLNPLLYYVRTHDGFEVDLLIEFQQGYIAFEIKMANKVRTGDAKNLSRLADLLDKPLLHGFLVSNDPETHSFASNITAVHAAYLLG